MKISFQSYRSGAFLTGKRGAARIIWSVVIAFFIGVGGSYLLEINSRASVIMLFSIVAILVCLGGAVGALTLLGWSKVDGARSAPAQKNVPRITSEWHYRPREAGPRLAAAESASAKTSDVLSPDPFAINNNVWFNDGSIECAAHSFVNLEPIVEDATTKAPLSGHACAVSAYD